MTAQDMIKDFEQTHPDVFSEAYKKLLATQPVEVVASKLNEVEYWLVIGGKVTIEPQWTQ